MNTPKKTVREELTQQKFNRTQRKKCAYTNAKNNQTELKENNARDTNLTNNRTEHKENSARDINVTSNQTKQTKLRETLT